MDSKPTAFNDNFSNKILKMRNNYIDTHSRERQIDRQIQLFIAGDMQPKVPEQVDKERINEYLNNPDFIAHLLRKMPHELHNLSEQFRNDKKYVVLAVEKDYTVLHNVSPEFKNDKEVITRAIKGSEFLYERGYKQPQGGNALQFASEELRNDKDLVLLAVKETGTAIRHASENLKQDTEVIKEALFNTKEAFQYLPHTFKDDKKFVLESIDQFVSQWLGPKGEQLGMSSNLPQPGSILAHVSDRLRDNKKVVLASIEHETEFSLKDVSERLQDDKEIVLKAIKKNSSNFKYASEDLRNDREVVYAAIKERDQNFDSKLLKYASEDLQKIVQEKGLKGLEEKPVSKLSSIINNISNIRDFTFGNESTNSNKYR